MKHVSLQLIDKITHDLIAEGIITADQLTVAKETQKNVGGNLAEIFVKKGFISEEQLFEVLGKKLHIPTISLKDYHIDPRVISQLSYDHAKKYHVIPLYKIEDTFTVATSDPLNVLILDEIKTILKSDVSIVIASAHEIEEAIATYYHGHHIHQKNKRAESLEIVEYGEESKEAEADYNLAADTGDQDSVTIVNTIITSSFEEKASDIHIEPENKETKVRFRIDGILEEVDTFPKRMHMGIVSRIKIMANMDVTERRIPQDGRVRVKINAKKLDLRISTYPTMNGEAIAIRLLSQDSVITLKDLGFSEEQRKIFETIIIKPHGMILVTGPTGSGKTTTLYAALQKLNTKEKYIISIEDPIENEIPGLAQAQINVRAGVTFASSLRAILRQDPDIIMVGEIRDAETAQIAARAAMTGHLLLSTLHTNTAIAAISRLTDLGVEPFLIASSLLVVMSQRLVRRICESCREERMPSKEELQFLSVETLHAYRGNGCTACKMTGYKGRLSIFEIITFTETIKEMITNKKSENEIIHALLAEGHKTMIHDAIDKVQQGLTSISEVMRVTIT